MARNSRQAGIWRTVTRTGVLACLLLGACSEPDASPQAVAGKDGTASGANKEQSVTANTTPARTQPEQEAAPKQHGPNRLAKETSPYLLMHAHNPVDWYPWGEDAFAKAKKENKVIFLSIGYSSCHWCHVMEKESFMNEEIAKYINEHFVCIKVDREERPDVDEIYMTSLTTYNQLTTGRAGGGWPLSMFMTPEGKPFVGGSYFPPQSDPVRGTGFLQLVQTIQEYWTKDEKTLREQADQLTEIVKEQLDRAPADVLNPLTPSIPLEVHESLAFNFDAEYGGFNFSPVNPRIPKFPEPSNLLFLLDEIARGSAAGASEEDAQRVDEARKLLLVTLDKMAVGGIYDHLGGGFHRYSVDRFWRVPHFEKMLYDNGQLASVYAEAYKLTGDERYRRVVEETLAFVQRELTAPEGAFYSALDADSEGEEGTFYVWTREQIEAQLNGPDAELFLEVFGITGQPNFEEKQYVLQLAAPLAETAAAKNMTVEELLAKLEPLKQTLFTARAERERPFTDTKILTSWNGLMIRGFADAGRLLEKPEYVDSARRAAEFLLAKVRTEDGRLLRTYTAGEAKLNAYLDDYAFLTEGLIALHKVTGEDRWLNEALVLTAKQIELFADANRGGFFFTSEDHEALIARTKGAADNVRPGGNSVSASNLLYLADHANKPDYVDRTLQTLEANSRMLSIAPAALPRMAILVRELSARGLIKPPAPSADAATGDNEPPLVAPPVGGAGQAAG